VTGTFVREDRLDSHASLTAAMRTSNQFAARGRQRGPQLLAAGLIAMGLFVVACGNSTPSVAPVTPVPTPVVTPNPHLSDPASADAVFTAIARAGLPISANNAAGGTDPVKQINATYDDWPMIISEYKSAASLAKAKPWTAGEPPHQGEAPLAIIGLNILIEWGPTTGAKPPKLDPEQIKAMNDFLLAMDPYIGPMRIRTTTPLDVPTPSPSATTSPSPVPSASVKPSPKLTKKPKPTKKP
jgi:hypothetical protein